MKAIRGLFKPWNSKNRVKVLKWIREEASLSDQKHLDILILKARHDKDRSIRRAAIERLDDQDILVDIVLNDKDLFIREQAVKRLKDQKLLAELTINAHDYSIRVAAVRQLTNSRTLSNILNNTKDFEIVQAAIETLKDQKILAAFASKGENRVLCENAMNRIRDKNLLEEIAGNGKIYSLRQMAYRRLSKESSQEAAVDRLLNDKDSGVREAAVEHISKKEILADVARSEKNRGVRYAAIKKGAISDIDIIRPLVKEMKPKESRKQAAELLKFLYHHSELSDEVRKLILQQEGRIIDDQHYDKCSGESHRDFKGFGFNL